MSETKEVSEEPIENGSSSKDSVKEENEKASEVPMEVDEEKKDEIEETKNKSEEDNIKPEEKQEEMDVVEGVTMDAKKDEENKLEIMESPEVGGEEHEKKEEKIEKKEEKPSEEDPEVKEESKDPKSPKKNESLKMEESRSIESTKKVESNNRESPKKEELKSSDSPKKEVKEEPEKKRENSELSNGTVKNDKKKSEKQSPKKKEKPDGKENYPGSKLTNREHILDHIDFKRDSSNRVKLYVLCDQRIWEDRGTGHVLTYQLTAGDGSPSNVGNTMVLVRLEGQNKNMLESRILMDTVYQKQQETLIVWSETDVMDLALSFQEKSGCEELWQKICEVQGRDPGDPDATYDDGDDSDVGELAQAPSRLSLPPIEIGRLGELDNLLHLHVSSNAGREKMTTAIENENVVPKLCEVFRMCEDIEHTEGLRMFYSIVKNLFMLNRNVIIEMLLDDQNIKDIIGMFEFDPAFKNPRKHRDFVYKKAKYREVLTITSGELREKIHRLYRAQYIQDACLPSLGLFEENLLSTLGSHIFFCRVDIVSCLQKDRKAMRELFGQLSSDDTEVLRRRDLVLFLKEMISLSSNIPTSGSAATKETFFKVLQIQNMFNGDILESLEPCFKSPDHETRAVMVDVLKSMVDTNAQMIRDFLLKQAKEKIHNEDVLLNMWIKHMLTDIDVHLTSGSEIIMIMKTLLDPETMTPVKSERSDFLQLFYQRCLDTLLKPLLENVNGGVIKKDEYIVANRLSVILRLLTFCVEHHSFSMRQRCVSNDLMNKVLVLLKSKHSFLVLSALKLLQRVVTVKDDKYIRYIVREKVLDPVMECFRKNGNRYNVINSAVLHLFDYVRSEDVRPLIKYVVENHMETIENVNYVKTFKEIKIRYDQHRDREETMSVRSEDTSMASPRSFRKDRNEDQWFEDEEDLEVGTIIESIEKDSITVSPKKDDIGPRKTGMEPMFPSLLKRKNAFDEDEAAVFGGGSATVLNHTEKKIVIKVNNDRSPSRTPSPASSPRASVSPGPSREDEVTSSQNIIKEPSPTPTVRSLVDYDESDSDEEPQSPEGIPSSSTGSPESDKEKQTNDGKKIDSPEYNDVSSTSNENEKEETTNGPVANNENGVEVVQPVELSRKRTSDGLDPTDVKRSRTEESSPSPTATEA